MVAGLSFVIQLLTYNWIVQIFTQKVLYFCWSHFILSFELVTAICGVFGLVLSTWF